MNLDSIINKHFRVESDLKRLEPVLRSFWQGTSRLGFSVAASDLAEINVGEEKALAMVTTAFAIMREQAVARRANLERFADVAVVSIGEDCFSRTVLTRWGVKKFAALGEKSGPFDLSVHRLPVTTELIGTDFAGYMNPRNLIFDEERNFCVDRVSRIQFNHETGPEYSQDDFALLIQRYASRLDHFRAVMAGSAPTAIVLHYCHPEEGDAQCSVDQLWQAIADRWGAAGKHLISINTWPHGSKLSATRSAFPDHVTMIDVAYPAANYVWHVPQHCFSEAGHAFEGAVVQHVTTALSALSAEATTAA